MSSLSILKLISNIFSGTLEVLKFSYTGLKAFGKFVSKYEKDVESAGEGKVYDPNSKKKHFLSASRLLNKFSEKNQLRIKKVIDLIASPSFIHMFSIISIGLMFLSPLGPIAAAIAASISITIMTGSFLHQTYKLRKNLIRKSNLHLLNNIKDSQLEIEQKLQKGEINSEMMNFYNQNISPKDQDFSKKQASKYSIARNIATNASMSFFQSCTILISAVLSFNIPSAVISGISMLSSSIGNAGRMSAELKATFELKQTVHNTSNELNIKTQTKTASVKNLHDKHLKQQAFKLACEKHSADKIFNKGEFQKTYNSILTDLRTTAPAPSITFWSAARDNIVVGFSMHKGLKQHSPVIGETNKNIEAIKSAVHNVQSQIQNEQSKLVDQQMQKPKIEQHKSIKVQKSFVNKIKSRREKAIQQPKTRS